MNGQDKQNNLNSSNNDLNHSQNSSNADVSATENQEKKTPFNFNNVVNAVNNLIETTNGVNPTQDINGIGSSYGLSNNQEQSAELNNDMIQSTNMEQSTSLNGSEQVQPEQFSSVQPINQNQPMTNQVNQSQQDVNQINQNIPNNQPNLYNQNVQPDNANNNQSMNNQVNNQEVIPNQVNNNQNQSMASSEVVEKSSPSTWTDLNNDLNNTNVNKKSKKKKSLLKIIIILLVFVILGGGGYFIYITYFKKVETPPVQEPVDENPLTEVTDKNVIANIENRLEIINDIGITDNTQQVSSIFTTNDKKMCKDMASTDKIGSVVRSFKKNKKMLTPLAQTDFELVKKFLPELTIEEFDSTQYYTIDIATFKERYKNIYNEEIEGLKDNKDQLNNEGNANNANNEDNTNNGNNENNVNNVNNEGNINNENNESNQNIENYETIILYPNVYYNNEVEKVLIIFDNSDNVNKLATKAEKYLIEVKEDNDYIYAYLAVGLKVYDEYNYMCTYYFDVEGKKEYVKTYCDAQTISATINQSNYQDFNNYRLAFKKSNDGFYFDYIERIKNNE